MPTPVSEQITTTQNGGLGDAAKNVAERASSIARLELELAALELKAKVATLGVGIGLTVGAAVFALIMLGFTFATIAAGLATFLPWWLALLIVTLVLGGLAAVLLLVGISRIKRATPPVPEQAIREAKLTTEAIKS
jgi:putative superfamily III holin-X